jgi:hypothetical protein
MCLRRGNIEHISYCSSISKTCIKGVFAVDYTLITLCRGSISARDVSFPRSAKLSKSHNNVSDKINGLAMLKL